MADNFGVFIAEVNHDELGQAWIMIGYQNQAELDDALASVEAAELVIENSRNLAVEPGTIDNVCATIDSLGGDVIDAPMYTMVMVNPIGYFEA